MSEQVQTIDRDAAKSTDFPIIVRGLRNSFGNNVIHDDLSLEVRKGEILGVVGGSGHGQVGADALDHRVAATRRWHRPSARS